MCTLAFGWSFSSASRLRFSLWELLCCCCGGSWLLPMAAGSERGGGKGRRGRKEGGGERGKKWKCAKEKTSKVKNGRKQNSLVKKKLEEGKKMTSAMPLSSMMAVAHREHAVAACSGHAPSSSLARMPCRHQNTSPRERKKRRKAVATAASASDVVVAFGDFAEALATATAAAASTSSSSSSATIASSFETAVYAISCSLDSMVKQSLAGTERLQKKMK